MKPLNYPLIKNLIRFLKSEGTQSWLKAFFIVSMMLGTRHVFATDLLENTTQDTEDTLTGSGRKWLILIDFAVAAALYIKTKNVMVFLGVLVITVAITSILPAFL